MVEFRADGVGVGVVDVGENGQGLLPGIPGRSVVAGGVVGIAEAGEAVGFVVAVADVLSLIAGEIKQAEKTLCQLPN